MKTEENWDNFHEYLSRSSELLTILVDLLDEHAFKPHEFSQMLKRDFYQLKHNLKLHLLNVGSYVSLQHHKEL